MKLLKPLMRTGFPPGAKYSCGHTGNKCHGGTGANAVPHARLRFTVTVSRSAGCVRISVRDEAPLEEGCPLAGGRGQIAIVNLALQRRGQLPYPQAARPAIMHDCVGRQLVNGEHHILGSVLRNARLNGAFPYFFS